MMITSYCLADSISVSCLARFQNIELRSNPRHVQPNAIEPCFCTEIERLAVFVSPSNVVRMLRSDDGSKVLALRRNNPEAAWTRSVQISLLIDFHSVPGVFAALAGCVEKHLAVGKSPVSMDFITHDHFAFVVPVVHVEIFFIRRERKAVGSREIGSDELQLTVDQAEDTAK